MAKSYYSGWELPDAERTRLLSLFAPEFSDVIAHHVTREFGLPEGSAVPDGDTGVVLGIASNGTSVQALVVEINGTTRRPDGKVYHVTWSLDRALGAKPAHSNDVIALGWKPVPRIKFKIEGKLFS